MAKTKTTKDPLTNWFNSLPSNIFNSYQIANNTQKYPETLNPIEPSTPVVLVTDLRIFQLTSGAGIHTGTLYTVPTGYFLYVTQLFQVYTNGAPTYLLDFSDSSSNVIWYYSRDGSLTYNPNNKLPEEIKLLAGDTINYSYNGAGDVSAAVQITIVARLEIDTSQVQTK